jgi:crotonobetainyl-CoA:carnitine CoA-transferase CaiB-like acyl-CoA transferase
MARTLSIQDPPRSTVGMADASTAARLLDDVLQGLDLDPAELDVVGSATLPGAFRVADAATTSVGAALVAASRWLGARRARLDVAAAAGVFQADRRLLLDGRPPQLWDPVAGDYPTADGWVRLHTNYPWHRTAALRALGLPADAARPDVAAVVAVRPAVEIETAVQSAGGAAAALRSPEEWRAHPQSAAVAARPLVELTRLPDAAPPVSGRPLRVLDLTRVIAGPTATKVLAAFGADVLRLDPPGFEELAPLVAETTAGKRCARLDIRSASDAFGSLVGEADVLVCGLRPGALERLGWPQDRLRAVNPSLVVAELSAYGDTGPWAGRRGFDSLVQTVDGIAYEGMVKAGADRPVPLPVQALDHASGWLLAAGVLTALLRRREDGRGRHVGVVLARTGQWIDSLGRQTPREDPGPAAEVEVVASSLGEVTRVVFPGEIDGRRLTWAGAPSPLGSEPPRF